MNQLNPIPNIKQATAAGLVCVTLDVHLWSGRKRLRKEALLQRNPELASLPPESLATLGSIKIADPADIAPFLKDKREADKVLRQYGLPLLGSVAIPEHKLQVAFDKLSVIKQRFDDRALKLRFDFEQRIDAWRTKPENQAWAHLIDDIPTPEYVAGRLAFGFHLCRVSAPTEDANSAANKMFVGQVTGLKGDLFAEAAAEADVLVTQYLTGKDAHGSVSKREKITWKTLGPLKRVAQKLQSFAFLDPTVGPLADLIGHLLGTLPKEGPIDGVHVLNVWTMAQVLQNPVRAVEVANLAYSAPSVADAFSGLVEANAAIVATAPAEPSPAPSPKASGQDEAPEVAEAQTEVPVPQQAVPAHLEVQFVGLF